MTSTYPAHVGSVFQLLRCCLPTQAVAHPFFSRALTGKLQAALQTSQDYTATMAHVYACSSFHTVRPEEQSHHPQTAPLSLPLSCLPCRPPENVDGDSYRQSVTVLVCSHPRLPLKRKVLQGPRNRARLLLAWCLGFLGILA